MALPDLCFEKPHTFWSGLEAISPHMGQDCRRVAPLAGEMPLTPAAATEEGKKYQSSGNSNNLK